MRSRILPHVTRVAARAVLLVVVLATVALGLPTVAGAATFDRTTTFAEAEEDFRARLNGERTAQGLAPLALDVQLTRVARGWSDRMLAEDRMYHNPELANQVKGPWQRLGENVGYTNKSGASNAELVERLHVAFMNSPSHRANVMGDYNLVGVGVRLTEGGKLWVTVNFMKAPLDAAVSGQVGEAVGVSRRLFGAERPASYVVLGRSDVFADALGGSGLAADQGPMLFTPGPRTVDPDPVLHPAVRAEIDRLLGRQGTVYLLGGTAAVSRSIEAELARDGYDVRRLAGASRAETAVKVAREMVARFGAPAEVLIARADVWADAVTGGAYAAATRSPVLLTDHDRLHPAVGAFLTETRPAQRWALGGTAALSEHVVQSAAASRIAGADRASTAVAIAEQLWGKTIAADGDLYVSAPGDGSGWAYALAYAPWSAVHDSPQLLVGAAVPVPVEEYLERLGYGGAVKGDVQAASTVPRPVVERLKVLVTS